MRVGIVFLLIGCRVWAPILFYTSYDTPKLQGLPLHSAGQGLQQFLHFSVLLLPLRTP
jgi:hypothetical protein